MAELNLDAIRQRNLRAHEEVCGLADGSREWRMRIPAQPERDSDLVISAALADAEALLAEVLRLREHSVTLNDIGWRIATALGDVPEGADQILANPMDQADRLIAEVGRLRALLADDQPGHVIEVRENGWTIQHPLSCRPNLFACKVNRLAEEQLEGPPAPPGRYECGVNDLGDRWLLFDRVDVDEAYCRVCGCTENAACLGGCRWATDDEIRAAGLEPMEGDLCSACLPGGGPR